MRRRILTLTAIALGLGTHALPAYAAPVPFSAAVFKEVVNEVEVVRSKDASSVKAAKGMIFLPPNFIRTGRKSRAQLIACDDTIIRVGANSVFSLDKTSRTIRLEEGSILFHSPTGKGGGTITTNSATASVIGTTIMVTATRSGGFRLIVLEGVAKASYPDGSSALVNAGQMTFVRPSPTGGPAARPDQTSDRIGPVLNFDLSTLGDSRLLNGFRTELASMPKIEAARAAQGEKLADGSLTPTGLMILPEGTEKGEFGVVPAVMTDSPSDKTVKTRGPDDRAAIGNPSFAQVLINHRAGGTTTPAATTATVAAIHIQARDKRDTPGRRSPAGRSGNSVAPNSAIVPPPAAGAASAIGAPSAVTGANSQNTARTLPAAALIHASANSAVSQAAQNGTLPGRSAAAPAATPAAAAKNGRG